MIGGVVLALTVLIPAVQAQAGCKPADFFIILDSSGSVADDFQVQVQWVRDAIGRLSISPDRHLVALMQFSGLVRKLEWSWDDYTNERTLLEAVNGIKHFKGTTKGGLALDNARKLLEAHRAEGAHEGRDGEDLIIILVSDGFSGDDMKPAADRLRKVQGVKEIYAVGVTHPVNKGSLLDVAGKEDNLVVGDNVGLLLNKLSGYAGNCDRITTPPPRKVNPDCKPADFFVILDSSGSVAGDFVLMKKWVKDAIRVLSIAPERHLVALLQFSGLVRKLEWSWDDYTTKDGLLTAVDNLKHFKGTTRGGKALDKARKLLVEHRAGGTHDDREDEDLIIIFVSDGFSGDDMRPAAKKLRAVPGVRDVFSVGVTSPVNR